MKGLKEMLIDEKSPKYAEYTAECKALFEEYDAREKKLMDEYQGWSGQDHPNGGKIAKEVRERNEKFRMIQKKYGLID